MVRDGDDCFGGGINWRIDIKPGGVDSSWLMVDSPW
jgi:hypothetical protein